MNDGITVLRITPYLFRPGVWPVAYDPIGGIHVQVWRITKALQKAGISQTVLTSHIPGSRRDQEFSDTLRVESVGISFPKFIFRTLIGGSWFFSIAKRLLKGRLNHDIVHIHYNSWLWCRLLSEIAHRLHIPVVVTLNSQLWVSRSPRWLVTGRHFNLSLWVDRWALRKCDCLVSLTEKEATFWTNELALNPERVFVIPDTIDPEKFRVKIDNTILCKIRKRFNIPNNKKIVTYIGRLRSEKGWQDLPEITEEVCDADAFMLICGDGPDRRKLENAMPKNRKENGWCITGFLDPDEIKAVLHITDVFVMPSRREAFGSVLLEVMAAGVPAIAYAVGGIVEVAGTPKAIRLIPPMDKFAFVQAILELLTDPKQCEYLIEQGHRRVEDFSIKHATEETLRCYQSLLIPNFTKDAQMAERISG